MPLPSLLKGQGICTGLKEERGREAGRLGGDPDQAPFAPLRRRGPGSFRGGGGAGSKAML